QKAQSAVVPIEFRRLDTFGFTIPAGTIVASKDDGVSFQTILDLPFRAGQLGPLTTNALAVATGPAGNVDRGRITTITSNLDDPTTTCNNPSDAAGGIDAETLTEFAERGRRFFRSARRGTREAILDGASNTPGVAQVTIDEVLDPQGIPTYRVNLIVADVRGRTNSALLDRVSDGLGAYRGLGVPVLVSGGVPQLIDIAISGLRFRAGTVTNRAIEAARRRVVGVVNRLSPQETLHVADIFRALREDDDIIVKADAITEPLGDLEPDSGIVLRTTLDRVSINGA
ncbi:MAG: baseplate J/gp47 family protein, partial [Nannocystaceae bacterium]